MGLWARTLFDLVRTALAEHVQEVTHMSPRSLMRWSGPVAMLGGLLWAASLGINGLEMGLWAGAALVCFLIGVVGLYARQRAGWLARTGLVAGVLAALVGAIGAFFNVWGFFGGGVMLLTLGMVLLGIASLRNRALRRWNALPLVVGLWPPLLFELTNPYHAPGNAMPWAQPAALLIYGLGWVALGYVLWSGAGKTATPPALAVQ